MANLLRVKILDCELVSTKPKTAIKI